MKLTFIILAELLLSFFTGTCQDVNVYWGKFNAEDRFATTFLLGERGDHLFAYKKSRNKISILKYNMSDLQVNAEYPLIGKQTDQGGKVISDDYKFDEIITLKDVFYVSVTKYDKKTKENSLYIQEIDNNGKLTGTLKKLETIDAKSTSNKGDFDLIKSRDSIKLLLVDYPPFDKYAGEKFTFTTMDEHLNQLKKLQVELPFKDKYFDLSNITYAKDGNIYMMAKITLESKEKTKGEATYYYEIVSINPNGNGSVTQYDVKIPQKYIDGIAFNTDDEKDLICSGFYGNMSGTAKGEITGVFFMRLNKNSKQVDATGLKELDKDFIADLTSTRKANKGRGISNDFTLRNFIRKKDGGAVLLAEYSYDYEIITRSTDSHGFVSYRTEYHYVRNNIIAININPDGSIKWCADIPKYQHTVNDNGAFISYMLATKGRNILNTKDDKLYLIYNENPVNVDPKKPRDDKHLKTMTNSKNSTAVMVALSEDGQFSKSPLFSNKENKVALMPSHYIRLTNTEFIIPAYNPGFWCCVSFSSPKSKLARIEFK